MASTIISKITLKERMSSKLTYKYGENLNANFLHHSTSEWHPKFVMSPYYHYSLHYYYFYLTMAILYCRSWCLLSTSIKSPEIVAPIRTQRCIIKLFKLSQKSVCGNYITFAIWSRFEFKKSWICTADFEWSCECHFRISV